MFGRFEYWVYIAPMKQGEIYFCDIETEKGIKEKVVTK